MRDANTWCFNLSAAAEPAASWHKTQNTGTKTLTRAVSDTAQPGLPRPSAPAAGR